MPAASRERIKVYCYPVDRKSTYVPLLFDPDGDEFERVYRQDGTLQDAIADLDAGTNVIVHVHWEEFVLREARSGDEADTAATAFIGELAAIRARHGAILWTVHNELPHEIPYHRQFLAMRSALARDADLVLVHNAVSRDILAAQVAVDPSNIRLLPHPSYLGRLESETALQAGLCDPSSERRIQAFGWIRLQKGFGGMLDMLQPEFLHARGAFIRISGHGAEAAAAIAERTGRLDVEWDVRHVPDSEVPQLLRSAACVILPYERVLTSGVALLAMSVGALIVGVDFPQLRELLPEASRRFLYPAGDARALQNAVDNVFALSRPERRALLEANLAIAREVRPSEIARRLAAMYRDTIARK